MIESYQTAQILAQELLAEAKENEPKITADLQTIAAEVSAEMVGLENKFKSKESLTRKLINRANVNSIPIRQVTKYINDALRYTFVLPFETYAEDFRQILESSKKRIIKFRKNESGMLGKLPE